MYSYPTEYFHILLFSYCAAVDTLPVLYVVPGAALYAAIIFMTFHSNFFVYISDKLGGLLVVS